MNIGGKGGMEGKASGNKGAVQSVLKMLPPQAKLMLIGAGTFFVLILLIIHLLIMIIADEEGGGTSTSPGGSCSVGGSCNYSIKGFYIFDKGNKDNPMEISDLKVRLMQAGAVKGHSCGGTYGEPIEGEELVPFEKYILGVVYGEMDNAPGNVEARKAQAIAARSYVLARREDMGTSHGHKLEKEGDQWILQITNCVSDQVYCDPDKGCSKKVAESNQYGNVYTGIDNPITYKPPLPEDSVLRTAVAETTGKLLLNDEGYVVYSDFGSDDQEAFVRLEDEGKDYTEILMEHYNTGARPYKAASISQANCTSSGGNSSCSSGTGATGDFKNWKQLTSLGAPWGSIPLGSSNINKIGCLATSVAIQIANSGISTGSITDFNPGTFVEAGKSAGLFDATGGMYTDNVKVVVPGFNLMYRKDFYGNTKESKIKIIKEMLDDNCYPVMEVKGNKICDDCGQHWVAVDYVDSNEVYMMDPASNETGVFTKYGNKASGAMCYKTG